ncbi:hypothetical protein PoB_000535600 [Plakobranchus ocellatus]|uniref:Uncharacterized protein n=1 Tax=Plakobranchus ocellatus TaxID=259542 RepID=A0AAV3Y8W0_9GAST|nr:hypothetical protein PoB_000535600 [Plakobranchus ocellatus]
MASSYRVYIAIICVMLCMAICSLDACIPKSYKNCEKLIGGELRTFEDGHVLIFVQQFNCKRDRCEDGDWVFIHTGPEKTGTCAGRVVVVTGASLQAGNWSSIASSVVLHSFGSRNFKACLISAIIKYPLLRKHDLLMCGDADLLKLNPFLTFPVPSALFQLRQI